MQVNLGWLHWIWLLGILYKLLTKFLFIFLFFPFLPPSPLSRQSLKENVLSYPSFLLHRGKQKRLHLFYCRNRSSLMLLEFLLCVSNQQNLRAIMRNSKVKLKEKRRNTCPTVKSFPFPEQHNGRWTLLSSELQYRSFVENRSDSSKENT